MPVILFFLFSLLPVLLPAQGLPVAGTGTGIRVSSRIPEGIGAGVFDDYGLTHYSCDQLYSTHRGDICRYLSDKKGSSGVTLEDWRMPTMREFGTGGNNENTTEDDPEPATEVGHYTTKWKNSSDSPNGGSFVNPGSGNIENGTFELDGKVYYTLVNYIAPLFLPPSFPLPGTATTATTGHRRPTPGTRTT
ncbi:MAG: hypothetical protein LBR26_08965 [Prevotella sp.]|nr:hypothetical protein [Prevotella sp.]